MDRRPPRFVAAVWSLLAVPVRAEVAWDVLLGRSREISMSGVLGLVETDILFAEPGTQQTEIYRILQSLVGIGCLRVISRICMAPSWEFLHTMYGIKQPEGVEAREFWLRQESWTEISALGLSQEDTSYHRINQGSGPQMKILWTYSQLENERAWWNEEDDTDKLRPDDAATMRERRRSSNTLLGQPGALRSKSPSGAAAVNRDALSRGRTPRIYKTRRGNCVSEGTTDKWFMDRWQCEVLAVAAVHHLTIGQASEVLTVAYFGHGAARGWHILHGVACFLLTGATFAAAMLTHWSWVPQLTSLSCLGYFTTRTACLRAWRFDPNAALSDKVPELLHEWPTADTGDVYLRVAVQSSSFCHLRGVFAFPGDDVDEARAIAQTTKRGRWRTNRSRIPYIKPYDNHASHTAKSDAGWLSYEVQSSWYGLVATVESDNVALRSASVVAVLFNGLVLLLLGFGASTPDGWNWAILGIYIAGIIIAIASRGRQSQWTMPEFQVVDLTTKTLPPSVHSRLAHRKDLHFIPVHSHPDNFAGEDMSRMENGEWTGYKSEGLTVIASEEGRLT